MLEHLRKMEERDTLAELLDSLSKGDAKVAITQHQDLFSKFEKTARVVEEMELKIGYYVREKKTPQ